MTCSTVARGDEPTVPVSAGPAVPLSSRISTTTTTIARFTVTPVPEGSETESGPNNADQEPAAESTEETISETCKEEMFLIGELSKIRPHEFEVSEEDDAGDQSAQQLPTSCGANVGTQPIISANEQSSTSTSCCSSSTVSTSHNSCHCCNSSTSPCQMAHSSGIASGNEHGSSTPRSNTTNAPVSGHGITSSTTSSITSSASTSATSSSATCPTNGTSSADALPHQQLSVSSTIKLYRKHRPSSQYQEYKV